MADEKIIIPKEAPIKPFAKITKTQGLVLSKYCPAPMPKGPRICLFITPIGAGPDKAFHIII
jgi:hypothetical protein